VRRCAALRQARGGEFFDPVFAVIILGRYIQYYQTVYHSASNESLAGANPVTATCDNREIF